MELELLVGIRARGEVAFLTQSMKGLIRLACINSRLSSILCIGYLTSRITDERIKVLNGSAEEGLLQVGDESLKSIFIEEDYSAGTTASIILLSRSKLVRGGQIYGDHLTFEMKAGFSMLDLPYTPIGKRGWVVSP